MKRKFAHLHLHTQYSILEGANHIEKIPDILKAKDIPACAITDHGNMHGAIEFYQKMKAKGIKPIIGQGFFIESFLHKNNSQKPLNRFFNLNILAINWQGYQNLIKLSSHSYQNMGQAKYPFLDYDTLLKYRENLFVIAPGIESEIGQLIKNDDTESAKKLIEVYKFNFSNHFMLEIFPIVQDTADSFNKSLYKFGKHNQIKMFASNNCFYPTESMGYSQYILTLIGKQKKIDQPDTPKFEKPIYYLKSYDEMVDQMPYLPPELFNQTVEIADICEINLNRKTYLLPKFKAPENREINEFFDQKAKQGLVTKFEKSALLNKWSEDLIVENKAIYESRLAYEMLMIKNMGYTGYFLIVADFVGWAKNNGVLVGPGRGSGAGSLVAYSLDITNVDPIEYDLLFERFLNPSRVSMPDFDIDFDPVGREKVIEYVKKKYGKEHVSQISAIGTLQVKAAIRSVARSLNIPYMQADRIAKLIPDMLGIDLEKALKISADLRNIKLQGSEIEQNLLNIAADLEGMKANLSTHAAGIVIMSSPINEVVPVCLSTDRKYWQTQYQMDDLETQGAVKFDLLGLRNLSIIEGVIRLISKDPTKTPLNIDTINLENTEVYKFLSKGLAKGIFQLESEGMQNFIKKFKPASFEELIALVGIYRPGPLKSGMADDFINRKNLNKKIEYLHPLLEPILDKTYGVIIYQEQVMRLAQSMADFTLGEADIMRRAMGKKKAKELEKLKADFLERSSKKGIALAIANKIFELVEKFAGYGFNKSHSAAYGLISYQTAYLKTFYRLEFMSVLMSLHSHDQKYLGRLIKECYDLKVEVLKPDINKSASEFLPDQKKVRFGLSAIKNLGANAAKMIIDKRNALPAHIFKDISEFYSSLDYSKINSRGIEALIKTGTLDCLYPNRLEHLANMPQILAKMQKKTNPINARQNSLLSEDELVNNFKVVMEHKVPLKLQSIKEYNDFEVELLGHRFSPGALAEYKSEQLHIQKKPNYVSVAKLKNIMDQKTAAPYDFRSKQQTNTETYVLAVNISKVIIRKSKNDTIYSIVEIEDGSGYLDSWMFDKVFEEFKFLIEEGMAVFLEGQISKRADQSMFLITKLKKLNIYRIEESAGIIINFSRKINQQDLVKLRNLIDKHKSQNDALAKRLELVFDVEDDKKYNVTYEINDKIEFSENFFADWSEEFFNHSYEYIYK